MGQEMLRCAQHDTALPYYCALANESYRRHVPVCVTLNISLQERHHFLPHKMVNFSTVDIGIFLYYTGLDTQMALITA